MNNQPTFRDVEQLSALLDGTLSQVDVARLKARLERDPELLEVYQQLNQTRALLRKLPQRRAPRNFTLKRENARVRAPLPSLFPTFRLASALAALLFFFTMTINTVVPITGASVAYYEPGMGGGNGNDVAMAEAAPEMATDAPMELMAPAQAPEATQESEMAVPAPTQAPDENPDATQAATATTETSRIADVPPEEGNPEPGSAKAAPATEMPAPPPRALEITPPIPSSIPTGLLTLAIVFGAGAALMYWNTNRKKL